MDQNTFEIIFDDITLLETDGYFKDVAQLMTQDFPYPETWMIKTRVTIGTLGSIAELLLYLYHDKQIFIIEYAPSQKDVFYNTDLNALMFWAQKAGWRVPQPHPDLVKKQLSFWKHFWETGIVDSRYLDKSYGIREHIAEMQE